MTITRRIANRKGSSYLTHGGDNYDHKGLNRARRDESKALCLEWEPTEEEAPVSYPEPPTFRVVLVTQVYENYGTHACGCESEESCTCQPYWKAKGGCEYQQPIGSASNVLEMGSAGVQRIVDEMTQKVEVWNRFMQESVIGWEILSNTEETYEEEMLRMEYEDGYLAPLAKTEVEVLAYYKESLEKLRRPTL